MDLACRNNNLSSEAFHGEASSFYGYTREQCSLIISLRLKQVTWSVGSVLQLSGGGCLTHVVFEDTRM